MCGIAGVISWGGADAGEARAVALAMAAAQRNRGPDGLGVWSEPGVGLAAARLTITGEGSHGRQPVVDPAGGVLVLNGEIYNYRALGGSGVAPGASDTEVLAILLAGRGPALLPALNGPFALARYDPVTRRLLLARDRVGKKPLYVARTPTGWAFASTVTALHVATGPLRIRPEAIPEYLVFRSVGGHHSAFAGVEQVPPGTWLELDGERVTGRGRFWQPPAPGDDPLSPDAVRRAVDDSVLARTGGIAELAVFLSGGLDSAVVTASLRRQRPSQPLRLISAGYDVAGPEDERGFALRLGAEAGVPHEQVVVHGERDGPGLMADAARLLEDPVQDPVTLPTLALARAAATFTRVVLSGDGADELWGGYARFDDAPARLEDYWPRAAIFQPGELGLADWPATYFEGLDLPSEPRGGDALDRIMRAELANRFRNYHLSRIDKLVMGTGVEPRCPYLDPVLVEIALGVPARWKRPGGRPKGLLVDAFRADLPAWLAGRRKQPFSVPIRRWLTAGLREFAGDLLVGVDAFTTSFVDSRPLFREIEGSQEKADAAAARLWSLLQLEVWHREVARPLGVPVAPARVALPPAALAPTTT